VIVCLDDKLFRWRFAPLYPRRFYSDSRCRRFVLIAAILFIFGGNFYLARAQDEVIRVDTNLVSVPVSVLDRSGKYISTLKQTDFKIFEGGMEQEITSFGTIHTNVTVVMLIERTGMIGLQLPRVVAAANAFVRQMRPEDSLIAMTFGSTADTVIEHLKIKDVPKGIKVGRAVVDKYGVQLFGSVDAALKRIAKIPGRKAIVIFSEGFNTDRFSPKSAKGNLRDAEESDATIYTIRFGPAHQTPRSFQNMSWYQKTMRESIEYMAGLAARTGGRSFQIEQIENLDQAFAEVAGELVRQYTLGYSPTKPPANNERRQVKVKVDIPGVVVRARKEVVYKQMKN
jgi:Ca-activated chloride channel homolog